MKAFAVKLTNFLTLANIIVLQTVILLVLVSYVLKFFGLDIPTGALADLTGLGLGASAFLMLNQLCLFVTKIHLTAPNETK